MPSSVKVFIDDSKDKHVEKFVIAAGVVGLKAGWNEFNKKWKHALHNGHSIRYFHGIEWRGVKGEFLQFRSNGKITNESLALANAKRNSLLKVVRDSGVAALSVTVDVAAWKRLSAEHPNARVIQVNPYKTALQELIYAIAKDADAREHKICFVCDRDNQAETYKKVYNNFREANPNTAAKIAQSIEFCGPEKPFGVQAADLIAHTINRLHQDHGISMRNAQAPSEITGIMSKVLIWDYEYGKAMLDVQTTT